MRIGAEPVAGVRQGHHVQEFKRLVPGLAFTHRAMDEQDLADLLLDGVQRVQRRHGFLEHHADAFAADLQHVVLGCAHHLLAVDANRSPGVACVLVGQELHDR